MHPGFNKTAFCSPPSASKCRSALKDLNTKRALQSEMAGKRLFVKAVSRANSAFQSFSPNVRNVPSVLQSL